MLLAPIIILAAMTFFSKEGVIYNRNADFKPIVFDATHDVDPGYSFMIYVVEDDQVLCVGYHAI